MKWDFFAGEPVSVQCLLESREARAGAQRALIAAYQRPIISFTCVMPGAVKRCQASRLVFFQGIKAVRDLLYHQRVSLLHERRRDLISGQESLMVTSLTDAILLKKLMIDIEQAHALGRLFDLDVISSDGRPISRADIGLSGRNCLVCGALAKGCASRKLHLEGEVKDAVNKILLHYEEGF